MKEKKIFNVVVAILIYDGKILCGKRGKGYFESQWEFPGGKIEIGESKEEALKREIREELGYEISNTVFYMTAEAEYKDFIVHMDTYLANCDRSELMTYVHQELRWIDVPEMPGYDWCAADKIIVTKIIDDGGIDNLIPLIMA